MKAEIVIKREREGMEEMKQLHERWKASGGTEGLQCFNYEDFLKRYNRTDEEILNEIEEKTGFVIVDKEEYLNKKKSN